MGWGAYAFLIIFGGFVLLMIINPNLSCFGKRLKSPFYPFRRKRQEKKAVGRNVREKMTDYKFDLGGNPAPKAETPAGPGGPAPDKKTGKKTDDYGFRLD
jgi:hypothetical protein